MLADQFIAAAFGAANSHALDQISRLVWLAHAEGHVDDAQAGAAAEAVQTRRAVLAGEVAGKPLKAASGPPRACAARRKKRIEYRVGIHAGDGDLMGDGVNVAARSREKMFGLGRPRALDRNAKARIMHWARCLSRRTEKGRAYGELTAKALAVLQALLWTFHNARSGLCFPSYERIAEAAHCARSTVAEAIKALEDAGVLSWVHRIKRVREAAPDLFDGYGWRWRVIRTIRTGQRLSRAEKGRSRPRKTASARFRPRTRNELAAQKARQQASFSRHAAPERDDNRSRGLPVRLDGDPSAVAFGSGERSGGSTLRDARPLKPVVALALGQPASLED
jgi:hypothetical protein